MREEMLLIKHVLLLISGLTFDPNQDFRRKRLELHPQELLYTRQSEQAMSELR